MKLKIDRIKLLSPIHQAIQPWSRLAEKVPPVRELEGPERIWTTSTLIVSAHYHHATNTRFLLGEDK